MKIKHLLRLISPSRRSILGLDLSSVSIKMLELSVDGSSFCLESYGAAALPPNTYNGDRINDIDALAHSIKTLFALLKPNSKQVVLAVPDTAIITKVLQIHEGLTDREIEEYILIEAATFIPYPMNEINLDFDVLGSVGKNTSLLEVLVVASRTEHVLLRVEAVRRAGLDVLVVDVASYAMARAVRQATNHLSITTHNKLLIIMDVNEKSTHLMVFQGTKLVYSREEPIGGVAFINAVATYFDMNLDVLGDVSTEYEELVLALFKKDVLVWIKRALHFYYATSNGGGVDHILLIGSLATFPGLTHLIQDELAVLTKVANPFSSMYFGKKCSSDSINNHASGFMLASGLALRGIESYADTH